MQKVLVVIDMQKDFVDGALGSAQAQMIVENVRKKIEHLPNSNVLMHMNEDLKNHPIK